MAPQAPNKSKPHLSGLAKWLLSLIALCVATSIRLHSTLQHTEKQTDFAFGPRSNPHGTEGRADHIANAKSEDSSCALLFFGLARSFVDKAYPEIEKHILGENPTCEVFVHTYDVKNEEQDAGSPRTINTNDVFRLTTRSNILIETEDDFREQRNVETFHPYIPIPSRWKTRDMDNMIRQWHSIDKVWNLMTQFESRRSIEFDRVAILRLDVIYTHPIRIDDRDELAVIPTMAFVPGNWNGLNDRLFYGSRRFAEIWASHRFDNAEGYIQWQKWAFPTSKRRGLQSEGFMRYLLTIHGRVPLTIKPICIKRVRSTGKVLDSDCCILLRPSSDPSNPFISRTSKGVFVIGMNTTVLAGLLSATMALDTPHSEISEGNVRKQDEEWLEQQGMTFHNFTHGIDENKTIIGSYGKRALKDYNDWSATSLWVMNDPPKLGLTLRSWLPLLPKSQVARMKETVLFSYSHPVESLVPIHIYGDDALEKGLRNWIVYHREAIAQSANTCRVVSSDTELLQDPVKQAFLIQDGLSRCSLFSRRLDIYGGINSVRDLSSGAGAAHDLDPQKGCKFIPLESALDSVLSSPYQLPASDRAHDLYDIAMHFYCDLKSGEALKTNYTIKSAVSLEWGSDEAKPKEPTHVDPTCLSPEKEKPWILDGSCSDTKIASFPSEARLERSCGFCGDAAAYLRTLRDEIAAKYKERCSDLVVYGAALGKDYVQWLDTPKWFDLKVKQAVEQHGTCIFTFFSGAERSSPFLVEDHQIVIHIDSTRLPYLHDRRNVKLLKLNPGLLFPWAQRIIWQDVKLMKRRMRNDLPVDYRQHFEVTTEKPGVCVSFQSLPAHKFAIGQASAVTLRNHCDAIIKAAKRRPTVSDDLSVLSNQCDHYYNIHEKDTPESVIFRQEPLIDSAFMAFDMRRESCRMYIGRLFCSWLDEIHCYSDRDQVSFSTAFSSSGLHLARASEGLSKGLTIYEDSDGSPMVHFTSPVCHWYNHLFSTCTLTVLGSPAQNAPRVPSDQNKKIRVSLIVAGTLQRFLFKSTVEKVIAPLTASEIEVDYYLSLSTSKAKAYRADAGYTGHAEPDIGSDADSIPTLIESMLSQKNAHARVISIKQDIDIDSDEMLQDHRARAKIEHPNEDPDQRFPVLDMRSFALKRTVVANRNLLKLHLAVQYLWREAVRHESESGHQYDYVLFMRDDSLWLSKFDLAKLLVAGDHDVYVPACDARSPPLHPQEINDHILISKRSSADVFGNYYSTLFETDTQKCMRRLGFKDRGCNSEMLLKFVMEEHGIDAGRVGQGLIPFQRSMQVKLPDGSSKVCFHKFCQSVQDPMVTDSIDQCKNIDWTAVFQ